MLKELREGQTLTVVEVSSNEITVEDDDVALVKAWIEAGAENN